MSSKQLLFMLLSGRRRERCDSEFILISKTVVHIEEKRGFVCILRLRVFLKVTPVSVL